MSTGHLDQFDTLTSAQRVKFQQAANRQYWILYVQIAIAMTSAIATIAGNLVLDYVASLVTFMLGIVWLLLFLSYRKQRDTAERFRRATLVAGGFGVVFGRTEFCDLMVASGASKERLTEYNDPSYYAAKQPAGAERIAEMLEESAFFSAFLFDKSSKLYWIIALVSICFFLFSFLAYLPQATGLRATVAVRVLCSLATLLVSSDLIGAAIAYSSAAGAVNDVKKRYS